MAVQYDEDSRRETVKLVTTGGLPISRVTADLGIAATTLPKWIAASGAASLEARLSR